MYDWGAQQSGHGHDPNLVGLLSLQLLLLAFFILLVNMSSFDEQRVRSVLGSVQSAFSEASTAPDSEDELQRADAITLSDITDEIEGVLISALQLDRVERIGAGAIAFDIAAGSLFAADAAQLAPGRDEILRRVVVALDRRPAGHRYDIEILVGQPAAGAAGEGAPPALEIARAGLLARTLHAHGALEIGLAAGILPGLPDTVRLVIDLTDQPRPHGLFAAGARAGTTAGPDESPAMGAGSPGRGGAR